MAPCITDVYAKEYANMINSSYRKNQQDALISQIYFGIELYMFRTVSLSITRSLVLYTEQ